MINPKKSKPVSGDVVAYSEAEDEENRGYSQEYYSDVVGRDSENNEATDIEEHVATRQEDNWENRKLDELLNENL